MDDSISPYENLKAWILQLPRVGQVPHRFGGTEFQVDGVEFMHSHGSSLLDIRLSKIDQETALKNGEALRHRFAPQAGWVSYTVGSSEDLRGAMKLIQLSYENVVRNLEDVKSRREGSRKEKLS